MKTLKRLVLFAAGVISTAKYFVNYKEEKEHKLILGLLVDSDERVKRLLKVIKLEMKFVKHPESKSYSDEHWEWRSNSDGRIKVPLDDNGSIIPSDKDKRLQLIVHERGHIKNKENGHFNTNRRCGHRVDVCLLVELEAGISGLQDLEKIKIKFEESFWVERFESLQAECKECLQLMDERKCPEDTLEKIGEYLNIISQSIKSEERNG